MRGIVHYVQKRSANLKLDPTGSARGSIGRSAGGGDTQMGPVRDNWTETDVAAVIARGDRVRPVVLSLYPRGRSMGRAGLPSAGGATQFRVFVATPLLGSGIWPGGFGPSTVGLFSRSLRPVCRILTHTCADSWMRRSTTSSGIFVGCWRGREEKRGQLVYPR